MNILLVFLPVIVCPLFSRLLSGDLTFSDAEDGRPAPFQPPSWVFGPVWFCLYLLLGIALEEAAGRGDEKALWGIGWMLALNISWTPIFLRKYYGVALVVIISIIVQATMFTMDFRYLRNFIAPYVIWVTYAAMLNLYYYATIEGGGSQGT